MAKILENEHGGRRMIRLSSQDVAMVVSMVQQECKGQTTSYDALEELMVKRPLYLPEEVQ